MKTLPVLLLGLLAAGAAQANEGELETLCTAAGGQIKRAALSGVQRIDCSAPKVSWFRVTTGGARIVGHYEATREGPWRPALETALGEITVICGELTPQLQFAQHKLIADCGSDQK